MQVSGTLLLILVDKYFSYNKPGIMDIDYSVVFADTSLLGMNRRFSGTWLTMMNTNQTILIGRLGHVLPPQ